MPPSPLMQDHALMAAHLHQSLNPALSGFGIIPRPNPNLPNFNSFGSISNGKISPHDPASLVLGGRHTPHSDGSAGSGSAGNAPTLNGTIEVKLEEVKILALFWRFFRIFAIFD